MMTDNNFQSMSVGFQTAEAPTRSVPQSQTAPTQVTPVKETQAQMAPVKAASAREPDKKEEPLNAPAPNDLQEKYDRLGVRYKHILEERDSLSRQVQELRRRVEDEPSYRHDTVEEIRLLNKLMDQEHALRDAASEKGKPLIGYDAFTRHDKFVNAFLCIVSRGEK